ncbi:MAG: hypothetical protein AAF402_14860, partial [Pseudomonadota bacterium]
MALFDRYRVVLSGHVMPEQNRRDVLFALAKLFNSSSQRMESLLQGKEVTLKKEYNKDEASKICLAIRKAGASCKVEKIEEVTLEIANEIRGDEV